MPAELISTLATLREATEHSRALNDTRQNGEVYGVWALRDGRAEVRRVTMSPRLEIDRALLGAKDPLRRGEG